MKYQLSIRDKNNKIIHTIEMGEKFPSCEEIENVENLKLNKNSFSKRIL